MHTHGDSLSGSEVQECWPGSEVQECWNDFWASICAPNGLIDMDQVKRELYDYHGLLREVPKVYSEVSGGLISKPNTMAFEVISAFNDLLESSIESATDCPHCEALQDQIDSLTQDIIDMRAELRHGT